MFPIRQNQRTGKYLHPTVTIDVIENSSGGVGGRWWVWGGSLVGEAILTESLLLQAHRTAGVASFKAFLHLNLFSHHSTVYSVELSQFFFSVPCWFVCMCIKNKQQQSVPHDPRQRSIRLH